MKAKCDALRRSFALPAPPRDAPLSEDEIEEHLSTCEDCSAWFEAAQRAMYDETRPLFDRHRPLLEAAVAAVNARADLAIVGPTGPGADAASSVRECLRPKEMLALLRGEMSKAEADAAEAHVASCAFCALGLEAQRAVVEAERSSVPTPREIGVVHLRPAPLGAGDTPRELSARMEGAALYKQAAGPSGDVPGVRIGTDMHLLLVSQNGATCVVVRGGGEGAGLSLVAVSQPTGERYPLTSTSGAPGFALDAHALAVLRRGGSIQVLALEPTGEPNARNSDAPRRN